MAAIHEHTEMRQLAARLTAETRQTVKLPSYDQVRREIHRLKNDDALVAVREGMKSVPRARESPQSFALSIPSPALLTEGAMSTRWNCMKHLLSKMLNENPCLSLYVRKAFRAVE